jgi:hypothetical protein
VVGFKISLFCSRKLEKQKLFWRGEAFRQKSKLNEVNKQKCSVSNLVGGNILFNTRLNIRLFIFE